MGITYGNLRTKSFIRNITKKRRYTGKNTSKLIDNFKKENDIVNKIPPTEKTIKNQNTIEGLQKLKSLSV